MSRQEPGVHLALARPAFYPDGPARVDVRETHISWVFLVGQRAYKLKKPLVLPFLDYGTPERRHEMCCEEVRLGQRLAPEVYLGVRAVARGDHGLVLAAEGDPRAIDYVVEMRRYDEATTLAARLTRGEVNSHDMVALGRLLAEFHARAPVVAPAGVPTLVLERRMTENFHELLAVVDQRAEIERVLALERFAHAFAVARAPTLNARAARGMTRDGHGDLRTEHVVLDGSTAIVDAIEFDPALRHVDVGDDLAFLVMELVAQGAARFASALVDAYREAGGDPGDDQLIAFYATYRALVRAKVALLRAAQQPAGSAEHGHATAAARDLLGVAERFAWRARMPLVIVVCGVPATGKSHLAQSLSELARLPHLSSDVTRKRLAPIQAGGRGLYSREFSRLTYAELGRRAGRAAAEHGGAVVDATFRRRADRDAFAETFNDAAPLLFVECRAPVPVLAARAARRDREGRGASDATLAVVMRESAGWEAVDEVSPEAHVALRSDRPVENQVADLVALLDRRIGRLG